MPNVQARVSEGMKAEIEYLIDEYGLWESESFFIREAIDEKIKKLWKGDRFCKTVQPRKGF